MNVIEVAALAVGLAALLAAGAGCKKPSAEQSRPFPRPTKFRLDKVRRDSHVCRGRTFKLHRRRRGKIPESRGSRAHPPPTTSSATRLRSTADIYTMSTPDGAKSIFESEPAVGAPTAPIGDAARLYSQSLVFRKGPYLVRIVAYQVSPQLQQAMLDLGRGIEKKLSQ